MDSAGVWRTDHLRPVSSFNLSALSFKYSIHLTPNLFASLSSIPFPNKDNNISLRPTKPKDNVEWYDRITGYVQQVGRAKSSSGGWNPGKRQELIDRRRFEDE